MKAILVAVSLCILGGIGIFHFRHKHQPLAMSAVLVSDASGHGSGVHIGHGYIVTAAHVVEDKPSMDVTDSIGTKHAGTVLWSNKAYDVALIRIDDYSDVRKSALNCSPPPIGANIVAKGNPLNLQNITTWGRVASDVRERGQWKLSFIADITIAPGMSGGPVFDSRGNVVGISVGVAVMPMMGVTAISYIVPSEAVCALMARA